MATFSIGDTVQLNSGGPNLVVEILYDNFDIGVTWINTEGAVKTMRAPMACFTLIKRGGA